MAFKVICCVYIMLIALNYGLLQDISAAPISTSTTTTTTTTSTKLSSTTPKPLLNIPKINNAKIVGTQDPKCLLPVEPGPCHMKLERFYYNSKTNMCEKFVFGGCYGNDNKFGFRKTCEDACLLGDGSSSTVKAPTSQNTNLLLNKISTTTTTPKLNTTTTTMTSLKPTNKSSKN